MLRAIIIILILILTIISCKYSTVIVRSNYECNHTKYKKGDTIQPLKNLDFDQGDWTAYLSISRSDFQELEKNISKATCLKTRDINLLKKMQKEWIFICQETDLATVESGFYLLRNGKLVFESGIVLESNSEGLQSREFGWVNPLKSKSLTSLCSKFKRVYWPIVIL